MASFLHEDKLESLKRKKICAGCISDSFLKQAIDTKKRRLSKCSYCGARAPYLFIEELSVLTKQVFNEFLERTSTDPNGWEYILLKHFDENWDRHGMPVLEALQEVVDVDYDVACDLQAILCSENYNHDDAQTGEESEFSQESHYSFIPITDESFRLSWTKFLRSLNEKTRFFNQEVEDHLKTVFEDLFDRDSPVYKETILSIGPDYEITSLFRVRRFNHLKDIRPALEKHEMQLGPPPHHSASAGRMNARGIAVFYGSNDLETAIAEVRPSVGSWIVGSVFNITRKLKVLDLSSFRGLKEIGSFFEPGLKRRRERAEFLRTLENTITRPVLPGAEDLEYIITQVISDYLAVRIELDGIKFRSAQGGNGWNIVLFHHACRVAPAPAGIERRADLHHEPEDGSETIIVSEHTRAVEPVVFEISDVAEKDKREISLQLVLAETKIKNITSVSYGHQELPIEIDQGRDEVDLE